MASVAVGRRALKERTSNESANLVTRRTAAARAPLARFRSAARIAAGHAFIQNLRCGHYELATATPPACTSRQPSPSSLSRSKLPT
jgi:hypothetical protein